MIAAFIMLLPLQGEGRDGGGVDGDGLIPPPHAHTPIPTLALPLKGRESFLPKLEVLP